MWRVLRSDEGAMVNGSDNGVMVMCNGWVKWDDFIDTFIHKAQVTKVSIWIMIAAYIGGFNHTVMLMTPTAKGMIQFLVTEMGPDPYYFSTQLLLAGMNDLASKISRLSAEP